MWQMNGLTLGSVSHKYTESDRVYLAAYEMLSFHLRSHSCVKSESKLSCFTSLARDFTVHPPAAPVAQASVLVLLQNSYLNHTDLFHYLIQLNNLSKLLRHEFLTIKQGLSLTPALTTPSKVKR